LKNNQKCNIVGFVKDCPKPYIVIFVLDIVLSRLHSVDDVTAVTCQMFENGKVELYLPWQSDGK